MWTRAATGSFVAASRSDTRFGGHSRWASVARLLTLYLPNRYNGTLVTIAAATASSLHREGVDFVFVDGRVGCFHQRDSIRGGVVPLFRRSREGIALSNPLLLKMKGNRL
jgi:hypothetical protein